MSIVSLTSGSRSTVTSKDLEQVAAKNNITIHDPADQAIYLRLLQSCDDTIALVDESPDYLDPRLLPQPTVEERKFLKPLHNPLNAWSHRCRIVAAHPRSSLLKGRKVCFKDNISIAGLPTTIGTFPQLHHHGAGWKNSAIDATVVSRVLSAGAVVMGSAVCENYSACPLSYSSATGPVNNPACCGFTAGGSSSGCAALVAANNPQAVSLQIDVADLPELAIGGDQGGSIRLPAAYTGIYGLKPTHGLVPYTGAASLHPMIDHLGPLATSVHDIAVLLGVMAGYDGLDPRMTPESPRVGQVKDYVEILNSFLQRPLQEGEKVGSSIRVGLLQEAFEVPGLDPEVGQKVYTTALRSFTAVGSSIVSLVSVPLHLLGPAIWTAATRKSMLDYGLRGVPDGTVPPPHLSTRWPPDQEMYELLSSNNPALVNIIFNSTYLAQKYLPVTVAKAHRKVLELRAAYDRALEQFDVLITPVAPTLAMPHPAPDASVEDKIMLAVGSTSNTCPFNITGHPAMSVPCGTLTNKDGTELPVGLQIIGRRFEDETVLKVAALFDRGRKDFSP